MSLERSLRINLDVNWPVQEIAVPANTMQCQ